MSVVGSDILNVAEDCLLMKHEAGYRSCISRAYYAMYHETNSCLVAAPHFSSNHHSNLIGYLTNTAETKAEPYDSKKLKVLGYNLKQQRDARNDADYHLTELTVTEELASLSLAAANLYFSKWKDLKASKAS